MTTIYKKVLEAKKKFAPLLKNKKAYNYNYADLEQVLKVINPPLWEQGLDCVQTVIENKLFTYIVDTESETELKIKIFEITLPVLGEEKLTQKKTNDIQEWGGAVTYLRRYSIVTGLGLASEADNDGNKIIPENNNKRPPTNEDYITTPELKALEQALRTKYQAAKAKWDVLAFEKLEKSISDKLVKKKTYILVMETLKTLPLDGTITSDAAFGDELQINPNAEQQAKQHFGE
jgi:hypothetical protein